MPAFSNSSSMPSTVPCIEPSGPRSESDVPSTESPVVPATQKMFAVSDAITLV